MAKNAPDAVQDAALDYVAASDTMYLCSDEPANFAGIAAVALADVTMAGGDFTKAAGTPSGRQLTVAAKSGVTVDSSGTADHVVLANSGDSTLRYVTTMTGQVLTSGNTVDIGSWVITIPDPT